MYHIQSPHKKETVMSKGFIILVAACTLTAACGHSAPQLDQESYTAGYHSAGDSLVKQGLPATQACEQALQASQLFQKASQQSYDTMSFNSGCYKSIEDAGDPVHDASGHPIPGA
jgi:hypothetical protein